MGTPAPRPAAEERAAAGGKRALGSPAGEGGGRGGERQRRGGVGRRRRQERRRAGGRGKPGRAFAGVARAAPRIIIKIRHSRDACARPTEARGPQLPLGLAGQTVEALTVRNQEEQRLRSASYELRTEDLPICEESPGPSLEEASAWAQSFDKLMLTPAGRNAFREFLRTEFSEENMLFWMACEELKKEANKTTIEEKARIIYEDYVSILSPKEVSLDSRVRETINRSMAEPSPHIFDDAQLQIYTLMHRDSYPRFMNSALYKDLLRSLSEKAVEA
ncbi:regulator of G-protein signaling 20 isoform X1 [Sagmatias obliquidens]|uniref:regulator of G-protein signaling 20 isoform X1 n=1 Tax=Sagmatias obliquidens TaxID=3371155 RepID=UPI000F43E807|nr:regulator of G-protein signaling 20 isoform X1 [Lagenorhynchus obliquidens]